MSEIKVSVVCTVYNHAAYLRETLDGIVRQKTNFKFEVLVHDDASTDNSAEIIREYEKNYPDLIKPICQKKNQFRLEDEFHHRLLFSKAQGEYIAICEGDDCWIDDHKLQKQYELLENHKEVDICAHNAKIMSLTTDYGKIRISNAKEEIIPFEEVVKETRGGIPTASLMLRKNVLDRPYVKEIFEILCIDITLKIVGAFRGGMLCVSDFMSVYHVGDEGSWTSKNEKEGNSLALLYWRRELEFLPLLIPEADEKGESAINERMTELTRRCLLQEKKYRDLIGERTIYNSLSFKTRIHLWLLVWRLGWMVESLKIFKKKLRELFCKKKVRMETVLPCGIGEYHLGYGTYPPLNSVD